MQDRQLNDSIECLLQVLLPSAFGQAGLQSAIHEQRVRIQEEVQPLRVDLWHPLGELMAARGRVTQGIFNRFVVLISARRTVCQSSTASP